VSKTMLTAINLKTPADKLIRLNKKDPDPEVRLAAKRNPNFPDDLTSHVLDLF
jgi:hypothetical protein